MNKNRAHGPQGTHGGQKTTRRETFSRSGIAHGIAPRISSRIPTLILAAGIAGLTIISCLALAGCAPERTTATMTPPSHEATEWEVKTASGLEALCFMNALAGNPLTVRRMSAETAYWKGKLSPEALAALAPFEKRIKENKGPLHSLLLKPFVAAGAESLDDVIDLCSKPDDLEAAIKAVHEASQPRNSYYTKEGFAEFSALLPPLKIILESLRDRGFEREWEERIKPQLDSQGARLLETAKNYNVVPAVERALGYSLGSDKVRFYLLEDLKPYGNHIIPGIFATEPEIPDDHIVRTAVHELMHDPCLLKDPEFWRTADIAFSDPFVSKAYKERNEDFGYNNQGYYYVENAVRALDQVVSEELGIGRARADRYGWSEDGGMHVLAPVFVELMDKEGMIKTDEGFRAFIIRMAKEGRFAKGSIEPLYREYFTECGTTAPK